MDKDLKHDIILIIVSVIAVVISLCPIIFIEVSKNLKNRKFNLPQINFKGGKSGTYICTKTEKEEDSVTESTATITYKNNIIKSIKEISTETSSEEDVELSYGFAKLFLLPFNMIDGVEMNIKKDKDKLITESSVDYDKLDINKIKKIYDSLKDEDSDSESEKTEENSYFKIEKGTKIEDVIKDNYSDYECKKQK